MVDTLVSLSLIAFLATAVVANFSGVFTRANAETAAASWQSAIAYAQSEALTRSATNQGVVRLCALNVAQNGCARSDGTSWGDGWAVYVQPVNTGVIQYLRLFPIAGALGVSTDMTIMGRTITVNPRSMLAHDTTGSPVNPIFEITRSGALANDPPLFVRQLSQQGWVDLDTSLTLATATAIPTSTTQGDQPLSSDINHGEDTANAEFGKQPISNTATDVLPTF